MLLEWIDILSRPYFREKYQVQPDDILVLINLLRLRGELVNPPAFCNGLRDPKNDLFLEATLAGKADVIVSGDADLLELTTFEGIPIFHPLFTETEHTFCYNRFGALAR